MIINVSGPFRGLWAGTGSHVEACRIADNNGNGLRVRDDSRVVDNQITDNGTIGLYVDGAGTYVSGNTVRGNADNYDIAAGNQLNLLICEIPEALEWPCSARLAGTLIASQTGVNSITVEADDVTIDLDGHALVGAPGSWKGIHVPSIQHNIKIRDGTVRNWGHGGVHAHNARNSQLVNLKAYTNGWELVLSDGLKSGPNSRIEGCVAEGNRNAGIAVNEGSVVSKCTASGNGQFGFVATSGCTVSDSVALNNGNIGIWTDRNCTLSRCVAQSNDADGIKTGTGCTIVECSAGQNTGDGIRAGQICRVQACIADYNSGAGLAAGNGSVISDCTAALNDGDGIRIGAVCRIVDNLCLYNGNFGDGAGIHATGFANRMEGNSVFQNDRGIEVEGDGSIIFRNIASANPTNYVIAANNKVGEIVSAPNSAAISGSTGGAGVGSTDPWANFSF